MASINVAQLKKKHGGPHQGWDSFVEYLFQNYDPKEFERSLWLHAFKATSHQPLKATMKYYQKSDVFSNRSERFKYLLFDMACIDITHLERNLVTLLHWEPQGIGLYWTNHHNLNLIQGKVLEQVKPFLEKDLKLQEELFDLLIQPARPNLPLLTWAMRKPDVFKPTRATFERFLDRTARFMSEKSQQEEVIETIIKPILEHHYWPIGKDILNTCIRNQQNTVLQFLIEQGYGIQPELSDGGEIAWACYYNNTPALHLLIDHGASPNAPFTWKNIQTNILGGLIGFGELVHAEYEESILALIERGADLGQALDDIRPKLGSLKDENLYARFYHWQAYFDKNRLSKLDSPHDNQVTLKPRL